MVGRRGRWVAQAGGLAALALGLAACGSGSDAPTAPDPNAPVIANLRVGRLGQGCVVEGMRGGVHRFTLDYTDADGDVRGGQLELVLGSSGANGVTVTSPVPGPGVTVTGSTAGQLTGMLCIATLGPSNGATLTAVLRDASGKSSNQVAVGIATLVPSGEAPAAGAPARRPALDWHF